MTFPELYRWAESHATGPAVSPVAVAVLALRQVAEADAAALAKAVMELSDARGKLDRLASASSLGGKAAAERMTPDARQARAKKAADARWKKGAESPPVS